MNQYQAPGNCLTSMHNLEEVSNVYAGKFNGALLTNSGKVFYWGKDPFASKKHFEKPVKLNLPPFEGKIKQISLGDSHLLILTNRGQLFVWGSNTFGGLHFYF